MFGQLGNVQHSISFWTATVSDSHSHASTQDGACSVSADQTLGQAAAQVSLVSISTSIPQIGSALDSATLESSALRQSLTDLVKEVMKPAWRANRMSREVFKSLAKTAVDRVSQRWRFSVCCVAVFPWRSHLESAWLFNFIQQIIDQLKTQGTAAILNYCGLHHALLMTCHDVTILWKMTYVQTHICTSAASQHPCK